MENQKKALLTLLDLFTVRGQKASEAFTPSQKDLYLKIVLHPNNRQAVLGPTGYGKTEVISVAIVVLTALMGKDYILASVKFSTSGILMKMVIDHLFDTILTRSELMIELGKQERLKDRRTKTEIRFRGGGNLRIASLHGSDDNITQTIGQHVPNIILDESPLLSPAKYSQVIKMLAGYKHKDTHLVELGNAIGDNHFREHFEHDTGYERTLISLELAIKEGRLDQKQVDAARALPMFDEFYSCMFPDRNEIDERGYRVLIPRSLLDSAYTETEHKGDYRIGSDIGGGGDYNAHVNRSDTYAELAGKNKLNDTMQNLVQLDEIRKPLLEQAIKPTVTHYIDDTGIGHGVSDRAIEKGYRVIKVVFGASAKDKARYANVKAEACWLFKVWLEKGGKLNPKDKEYFDQALWIKYKVNSDKVIIIEAKDDLKKRTKGVSPDFFDALVCTFASPPPVLNFAVG